MLNDDECQEACHNHACSWDNFCDNTTEDNPAYLYVDGSAFQDDTPREGTMSDPHRSLTGAMASLWQRYTIIKLLGTDHDLKNFEGNAFPLANPNTDPFNPF